MTEPEQMRISDADRHKVAEVLREAAGEGRLDLEELDERLEATYAAKVYGDLVPLLVDLPAGEVDIPQVTTPAVRAGGQPVPADTPTHASSLAIMSGQDRKGVWAISPTHTALAIMGGVTLDLREAIFTARETVITANAIMGGVEVYVNAHTHVVVEGVGIMGGFDQGRDKVDAELDAGSPVVRVKGVALMGGVTVTRKQMPGEGGRLRKMLGH
ncbi:DUF1707 SHOCT-like domain-containing protein [Nocardioides nanhaiensis]|uniref:DUF1707 domain-containing protein n=1 Tax=Nocardioides nanhaiensis TaxID=1476871 RepID=A0ABP8W2R2_9ACTN